MRPLVALVFAALICACASTPEVFEPMPPRTVWVVGTDGRAVGQATFTDGPAGVLIRLFLEKKLNQSQRRFFRS